MHMAQAMDMLFASNLYPNEEKVKRANANSIQRDTVMAKPTDAVHDILLVTILLKNSKTFCVLTEN